MGIIRYAILAMLLLVGSAHAQAPDFYVLKDANNPSTQFRVAVFDCPVSKICPLSVSSDSAGNPLSGAAGTTNPNATALYVQGVTGGVPVPVNGNITCSNCSGSGVSVPFAGAIGANGTPGGFKDGSGNFQPLLGDVTNGQWVSVKGTLPAFAATPTVNIGTAPTIAVTGTFFQATQPISAVSLPLPTGAASQTTLASILSALGTPFQAGASIANTSFAATQATASALNATIVGTGTFAVQAAQTGNWSVRLLGNAGASLDFAGQNASGTVNAQLIGGQFNTSPTTITSGNFSPFQLDASGNLLVNVKAGGGAGGTSSTFTSAFPGTGTAAGMSQGGNMVALTGTSGNLNVQCANCSGSGVSTADEAPWTAGTSVFVGIGGAYQTTATSNPLVSGQQGFAQLTINRALHTNLRNSTGVEIGNSTTPLQVSLANTAANGTALLVTGTGGTFPVTGTFFQATQPVSGTITANAGTNLNTSLLALEGGGHLASIDTKTPALGQALAAGSVPIVLTAAQLTTLTPLTSVTVTQSTGTNLHMVCDSGCSSSSSPSFGSAFPLTGTPVGMSQGGNLVALTGTSGSLNVNITGGGGSGGTSSNFASAFPAAGTAIGLTNGTTMVAWSATTNYGTAPAAIAVPAVNAAVTNTVTVSGSVTANAGTNLNTSLLALETGGNLATIATNTGRIPAQGQALAAASVPVVLTALQLTALTPLSTVAVTNAGTFAVQLTGATNNINNIAGTVSLPTGAATSANQTNKTAFTQLTDGTNAAATYTAYGTAPTGNVPGANVFVTNTLISGSTNADGVAIGTANASPVQGYGFVFNGTTWDRMRSGTQTGSVAVASADPCLGANKTNVPISNNSTSSLQLVALSGSTVVYVCSISLISAAANTVAFTTGTGTACATGTTAVIGSTTVANSLSLAANGGLTLGNGAGTIAKGLASNELCMVLGTAAFVSGNITVVQQ